MSTAIYALLFSCGDGRRRHQFGGGGRELRGVSFAALCRRAPRHRQRHQQRRALAGQRRQRARLSPRALRSAARIGAARHRSVAGGLVGSVLLLRTSDRTFVLLIPCLLLLAASLFSFGGYVTRRVSARAQASLRFAVIVQLVISLYGGYFGGGMGIMMLAVLSLLGMSDIHRMNALKTALATLINGIAVIAFILAGAVDWPPGAVMIVGAFSAATPAPRSRAK